METYVANSPTGKLVPVIDSGKRETFYFGRGVEGSTYSSRNGPGRAEC